MKLGAFDYLTKPFEEDELLSLRNFGQKSLAEIEQVLTERGLHFGMDLQKLGVDKDEL